MPRYVVGRTRPRGLHIPIDCGGAELFGRVIERDAEEGVTWISLLVGDDRTRTSASTALRPRNRRETRPVGMTYQSTGRTAITAFVCVSRRRNALDSQLASQRVQ
jgi:hypothetical protein